MNATDAPPPARLAGEPPPAASGERSRSYRLVEGLHLRQWALRSCAPLAALATNGSGWFEIGWWPVAEAPLGWWSLPGWTTPACRLAGVGLVVLAVWLRVLSKGVLVRKRVLTTGGVYRLVRHPFYLANLVGAVGVFALAGPLGVFTAGVWLAIALPVYAATVAGEEDGLRTLYREGWERYAEDVPALIPRPGRLAPPPPQPVAVTWANLVAEREPARGLRFVAVALLVGGLATAPPVAGALLGLAVAAYVASHVVPGPPSRRSAR